jgi:hypothetical protein
MEGADQILAVARVDAGLAADRAVDLGEQGGRHLHVSNAAQQDRRTEPGKIADHAAAEGDDRGRALDPGREQDIEQPLELRHALGSFAGGQHDAPVAQRGGIEARLEPAKMPGCREALVGHDHQIARAQQRQLLAALRQQTPADHDVIASVGEIDPQTLGRAHDAPSWTAASACSVRATTSPIGPLPLSTIKSASA